MMMDENSILIKKIKDQRVWFFVAGIVAARISDILVLLIRS